MKTTYKRPLAITLLASTSILLAACDGLPFGNQEPDGTVLETWEFKHLDKVDRHAEMDNEGFEFYLKRLNTINTAIQTAADPEAFAAMHEKGDASALSALDTDKAKTFTANGHTFEVTMQENGYYTTHWLKDGQALEIELEGDGLSPKLDAEGNPTLATHLETADEASEMAVPEPVRPATQPMSADEQFQLGVAFLWLSVEDYLFQNPQTDNLTDTKEALRTYFETIQPAMQQLKQLEKAPKPSDANLVTLREAWEDVARVYHEESGNLVNGKKPTYTWEGKVVAAFSDSAKTKIVHLHRDYIEGYKNDTPLTTEQVGKALEKMQKEHYVIGTDTQNEWDKKDQENEIVKGVSVAIGADGSIIMKEKTDEEASKELAAYKHALQAEASALYDTLKQAEDALLLREKMAVRAPSGELTRLTKIQETVPDYQIGDTLTTEQWHTILNAKETTTEASGNSRDEAVDGDGSDPEVATNGHTRQPVADATERDAERAAKAKQAELERDAKNKARELEREQKNAQRDAERAQKEADKERDAQLKLTYENKVVVEERHFDALYAQEEANKAFDTTDKKYMRLRNKVLSEDYLLAVYTTSYAADGFDAKELGKLRDYAIKLEDAIAKYTALQDIPERFTASDAAFKAYVANRTQVIPGYIEDVLNGNVSKYVQDFGGVLKPLGGYDMGAVIAALRTENPSAISSFGSVYVAGLYQKYFKEMGWL